MGLDFVHELVALPPAVHVDLLLPMIAKQAAEADRTRTIDPAAIDAIKASDVLAISATRSIGGGEESIAQIGWELAALAAACPSTAWCVWNHLCVFHLFCGALGAEAPDLLASIVTNHEWVCFPAGAGSRVLATAGEGRVVLDGPATFGSGARYADWAGVAFALSEPGSTPTPDDLRFSIVRLDADGVTIEPTWDGASLRASSTDTIRYRDLSVPLERCVRWFGANRAMAFRDPELKMLHDRYREDWVGLSDLWLAAMAAGVCASLLTDAVGNIKGRKALMGTRMDELATVQLHLGEAAALVASAVSLIGAAAGRVDDRLDGARLPSEADYEHQQAASTAALRLCDDAASLITRMLGGNGLREVGAFERRLRDLRAMSLHINAHPDRVYTRLGQLALDVTPSRF
jgi:alkylation response protein AidB-like acyl-CoA dehydrogenase